ncbi:hypothetical protein BUALT_Bualt02G0153800 [Buddleja alternifolia]|uniref:Uncharacterized protein n=1 Tax=Buddleja alternifolia TaxID=168488 RepID=A0AAV6Y758_9LAMI|nr:hypothetical protein BUALT_Bualt02G0153800 [Buddleja alternifolia]
MPQLRHIMMDRVTMLAVPFFTRLIRIGEVHLLESLQTLSNVLNFRFTIYSTEPKSGSWEWEFDNLRQLEELKIRFDLSLKLNNPFPKSFAFPLTLKKLSLYGCGLPWEGMSTAAGSLPNLEVLKIRDGAMVGEEWKPVEGEFLRLNFLVMEKFRSQVLASRGSPHPAPCAP